MTARTQQIRRVRKRLARWRALPPIMRVALPDGTERDVRAWSGVRRLRPAGGPARVVVMYDQGGNGNHLRMVGHG